MMVTLALHTKGLMVVFQKVVGKDHKSYLREREEESNNIVITFFLR